jgi:predicted NBD/HSP70 family sugar kinase
MIKTFNRDEMAINNKAAILRHIGVKSAVARKDLAEDLDLSRPTLTRIANEFLDNDLIIEDPVPRSPRNEPRSFLRLNPERGYIIAVSMFYNLAVGVVDFSGKVVCSEVLAGDMNKYTHHDAYKDSYKKLIPEAVKKLIKKYSADKIFGIGVLSAGFVDSKGIIFSNESVGKDVVDMEALLSSVTDFPVFVDEEFRLLLNNKLWQNPKHNSQNVVVFSPGIFGAGGGHAFSVSGSIYRSKSGMAGLAGWRFNPPADNPETNLVVRNGKELSKFGAMEDFLSAVRDNDNTAAIYFDCAVEMYAYRLAQIFNLLDPDVVYLYTCYIDDDLNFLDRVKEEMKKYTEPLSLKNTEIVMAGIRTDEEHLAAAAIPVLSHAMTEMASK